MEPSPHQGKFSISISFPRCSRTRLNRNEIDFIRVTDVKKSGLQRWLIASFR